MKQFFLCFLNVIFEKLTLSISSPPVSTDGAAHEAEEGAVRGPEGGGGD